MRDVSSALRFLLKKPGWAVAAVLTVALGIAGSTLAFSLVDRALWRPLGFVDGGALVQGRRIPGLGLVRSGPRPSISASMPDGE